MSPCITIYQNGKSVGVVCVDGPFRGLRRAKCPRCCLGRARTLHAWREVSHGYFPDDMICGRCGQQWSYDDEGRPQRPSRRERDENIATVRALRGTARKDAL